MKRIKRTLGLLVLCLVFALSLFAVACNNDEGQGGGNTDYKLTLDQATVSLDKGQTTELGYTLTKDGVPDTTTEVTVACNNDNVTYNAADGTITAVKVGTTVVTFTVKGTEVSAKATVTVPEYTIEFEHDVEDANLGQTVNFTYAVRKDGLKVTDKKVNLTVVEGSDIVTYNKIGNRLTFNEEGTVKVKAELNDDAEVSAIKTYNVKKSLWSSEHTVNKVAMTITDDMVVIPGGGAQQYFLGVMDGGTKYVFQADMTLPSFASDQSVGLGHTLDLNDHSLWFGLRAATGGDGYRLLIKDYYNGWAGNDYYVGGYDNIVFDTNTITCIIIRDGQNYWYSIGGLVGTFTSNRTDKETWAGIYSQETAITVTNFSYSTEDEVIDAAKALCEASVVKFELVNPATEAVKGTMVAFKTQTLFAPDKTAEIVWSLNKDEMTSGQDGTSIAGGQLTLAPDAAGKVTVIATCGGIERSVTVDILQQSLRDENDLLTVDGGIELNEDGSVVFPEKYNSNNASISATEYVDLYYAATLKDTVKGDFSLSFTVSDLKVGNAGYVVSLGDRFGNFFFTKTGVSVVTNNVDSTKKLNVASSATAPITATFAEAETYNVEIAVEEGHYTVMVNGEKLSFGSDPIRRTEDYAVECNVLITTQAGTSMKLSNIRLSDTNDTNFIILNSNTTAVGNGFESVMIAQSNGSWVGKDESLSRTYYGELLPAGDYTIEFNVKFNKGMADAKLGVQIGSWEYHVNNKITSASIIHGQLYAGSWGDAPGKNSTISSIDEAFDVTLKNINGTIYFYIGNTLIASHANAPADRILSFWTFDDGTTADGKVEVTDLTVTAGAAVVTVSGDTAVQAGTMSGAYTANVIGASANEVIWTMNDDGLTGGEATFDEVAHTVTFSTDAVGSVVVTATAKGASASITVTVTQQPADQNTELAESVGGVKQSENAIIFDDAAKNGVADEQIYSENSTYYAILNTAANTRATIQDNFILEFTVSDYVSTAQYPKLMISLGGKYDQIYVVYNASGAQIQTMTSGNYTGLTGAGVTNGGHWINSADFGADFDKSVAHTYTIRCEDGVYSMTVDGVAITGWNMDGNAMTLVRNPETMALPRNIMFSTNEGTTATVSDISLTYIAGKEDKVTKTHAEWITEKDDGSIEVTMAHQANGQRWDYHNPRTIYTYGEEITDNCVVTMDIKFAAGTYTDEALLIKFSAADNDVSIGVIANGDGAKVEVQKIWGGTACAATDLVNGIQLKIVMTNGVVTSVSFAIYDGEGVLSSEYKSVTLTGGDNKPMTNELHTMSFGTFIYQTPSNNKVTISNITVTAA